MVDIYYIFFLTHFWIFRLISHSPNRVRFDCMIWGRYLCRFMSNWAVWRDWPVLKLPSRTPVAHKIAHQSHTIAQIRKIEYFLMN